MSARFLSYVTGVAVRTNTRGSSKNLGELTDLYKNASGATEKAEILLNHAKSTQQTNSINQAKQLINHPDPWCQGGEGPSAQMKSSKQIISMLDSIFKRMTDPNKK
ncbi:hypothetical protein DID78_04870 [Candidatus Marinamargulisbacteria bacterium SCGC AG-343-D04]|nr:hypothetical protein DID78_04870 [Candidatus Marinamargulisbacteria bacterium SCGC AG-343-D04]